MFCRTDQLTFTFEQCSSMAIQINFIWSHLALLQYYAGFLRQFGFFGADFFSHMVLQARAVFEYFHTA